MAKTNVTVARIYLTESRLGDLLSKLHDDEKVQGVTAFRGIAGFGKSGNIHSSGLLDISLELPVVVEFFDSPEKVESILDHLEKEFDAGHIIQWSAQVRT